MVNKIVLGLMTGLLSVVLTSCSDTNKNTGKYKPVLNPEPKNFVLVKGVISNTIKKSVDIKWHASYYTQNPKCKKIINKIEGVSAPFSTIDNYSIQPEKNGHYSIKIPTDKYLKGVCNWQISQIYYSFKYRKQNYGTPNTVINFTKNEMIWPISAIDIQAVEAKSRQSVTSPSIVIDDWHCTNKCSLTTSAKKAAQYLYIVNFNRASNND